MEVLMTLVIGAAAGWLGSLIWKGGSLGLIGNIIVGILGSFVGYWVLGLFKISFGGGVLGSILTGAVGAIVILFIINLITDSRKV